MSYVELRCASAFSFLEGASQPEDLVERAAELGLPAVALVDRNTVSGAPRFWKAAKEAGIKPLVGAEVVLDENSEFGELGMRNEELGIPTHSPGDRGGGAEIQNSKFKIQNSKLSGPLGLVPDPPPPGTPLPRLTLLACDQRGYRNLCRLLTEAARGRPKGKARAGWRQIEAHADGLLCLTGGAEGVIVQRLVHRGLDATKRELQHLHHIFPNRLHVELQRHRLRSEEHRNQALVGLAQSLRLPLVATGGVRYARPENRDLADVLGCIREGLTLDTAGRLLEGGREHHLRSPREMEMLFADQRRAVAATTALADELEFTLDHLGYRFPDYPLPVGESPIAHLRRVTWDGARTRFRPLTARAQAQLEKELDLIEKLELAGYFLIVWDIVRFCQREGIMAQGRGSAANSAVCYALSITAVDPVKMELLFERFLSEERGEWPDIDLDLPSGDQREKVIQYVYQRYGPHGAAMTANVITYRARSAAREVGKALGFSLEQVDRISKRFGRHMSMEVKEGARDLDRELAAVGLDPSSHRVEHFKRLWWEIHHLPRHLGQHSGGMVIAQGRLDEVVPMEPAAMEKRTVIQWDKDDCADLGLIKVDLLGLGMMAALEEAIPMIRTHERVEIDLAHLPPGDPKTYDLIRRADTAGVFQIESRAQMASLPRNNPENFYDLVVQVAIIRPGPITGNMTNPYLERRQGREAVTYAHPCLEPILERTLGVPLFQEQLLRMAMEAAGFSGGEAEELRRAMGFKRSQERMAIIEKRLRSGMTERGITGDVQEQIVRSITSFALYGFPESHSASFALLVYASAYLKTHHPTAFYACLLNAWPMGFYHPATLVKDGQRRGVRFLSVDVNRSGWRCRWEDEAVRIGLRYVHGLKRAAADTIEQERDRAPFADTADLAQRCDLSSEQLERLAHVGALASLGLSRRVALWQVSEVAGRRGPLFADLPPEPTSPLEEMMPLDETVADYAGLHLTTGPHLMAYVRQELDRRGVVPVAELEKHGDGESVRVAGAVIVRQRPGTAKGFVFLTMEDETGMMQTIIRPDLFREQRAFIVSTPVLLVEGTLQKQDGTISVRARRFEAVHADVAVTSHDFH
ncbi:MAG: error-prone DNA polymerase [Acidobacteria bacterium]|jgi:error-prone DNA polymerase|nr:error-prone DNA polymerase [Acidobacteriota bacterium]